MSGNDEQVECPLCMEPLEIDDINFFPCTCGYQICRFCWHRIRTDENGLCPACRKAYPEDPAKFNPLTEDELQRIKKERRQKDLQRKQKAAENRKHLANVRVVQRNLVFVVGLSQRLADPEVLKKHEYFGKFGKIHKVVINQSTSYAGAQGPSASAYVTYNKAEDALKAILAVNNVHIDGRTLKASLGTTKYCSHFLRGTQCPKTDCMYLHELGEEAASFTKEEMQVGKHQEYEQKLLESYMNSQNSAHNNHTTSSKVASITRKKASSPTTAIIQPSQSPPQSTTQVPPGPPVTNGPAQRQNLHTSTAVQIPPNTSNKDGWPSLQQSGGSAPKPVVDRVIGNNTPTSTNSTQPPTQPPTQQAPHTDKITDKTKPPPEQPHNRVPGKHRTDTDSQRPPDTYNSTTGSTEPAIPPVNTSPPRQTNPQSIINSLGNKRKSLGLDNSDNLSLFSSINGFHGSRNPKLPVQQTDVPDIPTTEIPDTIPVSSSTDWQAAFGFGQSCSNKTKDWQDDDLGFDPLEESSKGLADLLEKENVQKQNSGSSGGGAFPSMFPHPGLTGPASQAGRPLHNNLTQSIPPGFSVNHIQGQTHLAGTQKPQSPNGPFSQTDSLSSRMMGYGGPSSAQNSYPDMFSDLSLLGKDNTQQPNRTQNDCFSMKDWQDGLRALLPNINISFGASQQANRQQPNQQHNPEQKNWSSHTVQATDPSSWMACDPAILTSGTTSDGTNLQDPHWFKSINQLTDLDTSNHRLPFVQQFPVRNTVWPPQTHNPPPGFQSHIRPPLQTADPHKLAEGLQ